MVSSSSADQRSEQNTTTLDLSGSNGAGAVSGIDGEGNRITVAPTDLGAIRGALDLSLEALESNSEAQQRVLEFSGGAIAETGESFAQATEQVAESAAETASGGVLSVVKYLALAASAVGIVWAWRNA